MKAAVLTDVQQPFRKYGTDNDTSLVGEPNNSHRKEVSLCFSLPCLPPQRKGVFGQSGWPCMKDWYAGWCAASGWAEYPLKMPCTKGESAFGVPYATMILLVAPLSAPMLWSPSLEPFGVRLP